MDQGKGRARATSDEPIQLSKSKFFSLSNHQSPIILNGTHAHLPVALPILSPTLTIVSTPL